MKTYNSIGAFWRHHVPTYKSGSIRPFFVRISTEGLGEIAQSIRAISARRSDNRIASYVDPDELLRLRSRLGGGTTADPLPGSKDNSRANETHHGSRTGRSALRKDVQGKNRAHPAHADDGVSKRRSSKPRDFSIRFGVKKAGHGYGKERGDFCLVSAVYSGKTLTLFYRSIELIGGFGFDLVLIEHVIRELGINPDWIEIWATKAFTFALKGNSNEKLYPKIKEILK